MTEPPGSWRRWILAARTRTLPAAIVPVAVGAASVHPAALCWGRTVECAVVALALQIGTNYANDYADGIRGTDANRVGPFRLTASGLVRPTTVRTASFAAFGVAAAVGIVLAAQSSWWLVAIGASAILAGWFYTGGPKPYGYLGLGELFVFLYFGFVATVGTAFVQQLTFPSRTWWLAASVGGAACVLLEANNLRDIDGDRAAGKRTMAARLGRTHAPWLVTALVVVVGIGAGVGAVWWEGIVAAILFVPALRLAWSKREGRELLPMLAASARAQLLLGLLLVVSGIVVK